MKFDLKTFNGEVFGQSVDRIPQTKKNELIKSRAMKKTNTFSSMFGPQTGSYYGTRPFYGLIEKGTQNYDGQTNITSQKSKTFTQSVIVVGRADAWTEADFSEDVTGGVDFMENVASQISEYWDEVDQDTLLSILKGIFSMTGARNLKFVNGHTYDITGEVAAADQKVNETTCNSATQKACGDNKSKFSLVIMHSAVSTNLENLNLVKRLTYTDPQGIQRELNLGTWNGKTVLIDDSMPAEEVAESSLGKGDGYTKYTTYVLGDGAFDYEDVGAAVPYEMDRDPAKNGGENTLYSRQRKVFAPYGISFTKSSMATLSPTNAELEKGANWELINDGATSNKTYVEHKAIPIARIISRG